MTNKKKTKVKITPAAAKRRKATDALIKANKTDPEVKAKWIKAQIEKEKDKFDADYTARWTKARLKKEAEGWVSPHLLKDREEQRLFEMRKKKEAMDREKEAMRKKKEAMDKKKNIVTKNNTAEGKKHKAKRDRDRLKVRGVTRNIKPKKKKK